VPRRPVLTVFALSLGALAACGGGGGDGDGKQARTTTTQALPVAPLTGLPDPEGLAQGRPALTVKVDNVCNPPPDPCVRPQSGLEAGDVVYEEVAEGGITRFAAVFNSQVPPEVGPIRSVRAIDSDLVAAIGGVFAYSGGVARNVDLIRQVPVNALDETGAGDAMFRNEAKASPHNLFGNAQALLDKGGQPVPPAPLFEYLRDDQTFGGEPVTSFTVRFERPDMAPTYTYDAATRTWKRDIAGQPFTAATGTQIAPTNVIVKFIQYTGGGEGIVLGDGDAWVFADGKLVRGRWARSVREQPAQYVDAAGRPIRLVPGTTWVELLPVGAPVDVVAPPPTAPVTGPASS
jgi:hypothetical protein